MKFEELYRLVEEQNIVDVSGDDWTAKSPTNAPQMANSIFAGAWIDQQMRDAGYSEEEITKYWSIRHGGISHENALKTLRPSQSKETFDTSQLEEINIDDEAGRMKAVKTLTDKIGSNHPDIKRLQTYLNLKDTMYSNSILGRHDINITFIK